MEARQTEMREPGLGKARPFLVHGGAVEIYAPQAGGRRLLARVEAGGIVFPAGDRLTVVSLDAELEEVDWSAPRSVEPARLATAVDAWLAALSASLAQGIAPRDGRRALAPGTVVTPDAGDAVGGRHGIVWARVEAGTFRLLGLADVEVGGLVPLGAATWLQTDSGGRLTGMATADLLDDTMPLRMERFLALCLLCLARLGDIAARDVQQHRAGRQEVAEAHLDTALRGLCVLSGGGVEAVPEVDPSSALAAALRHACRAAGIDVTIPDPARRRRGDRPPTIEQLARAARIRVRPIMLRGRWWEDDLGAFVTIAADGRPLAVRSGARGGAVIDPTGVATSLSESAAAELGPQAWVPLPPLPHRAMNAADLLSFGLKRCHGDVLAALLAGLVGGVVGLAAPVATGFVFDDLVPGHLRSELVQVGLALAVLALVGAVAKVSGEVALLRVEGRMGGLLQGAVIDRLLRLPARFFADFGSGDLALRALSIDAVRRILTGLVLSSLLAGMFSVFGLALLFAYHQPSAISVVAMSLGLAGAALATGLAQVAAMTEAEAVSGTTANMVSQIVSAVPKLRLAGAEDRAFAQWAGQFGALRIRLMRAGVAANRFAVFLAVYETLGMAIVFAVMMLSGETVGTGSFLAFVAAFAMFQGAATQLAQAVVECFAVMPLLRRAAPILDALPEVDEQRAAPGHLTGDIEVSNLSFRYGPDLPWALNAVSLRVRPGEFVAIVGPSGCGKSTLIRLLLGFEKAETGGIFYDGHDLGQLDTVAVRRQIGVVLQSGRLMPGSILENIRGASDCTLDEAWEAARIAGIADDIRAMPMAMHTYLAEGASLSGGQVQRLLIARAVVARPRILFFDEATSALDNQTQASVMECLNRLAVSRLVIAHRLSTVAAADRVVVLDQGRVVETGTCTELLARGGLFATLARRQTM
ncbi:MAG: NHLP bacteriocin export ABC transporter permease/ATPase subunit [Alphaproteobacteria bacterium]|nr:NHLP bacteriocin export ABC transporter permease/ATPase subunit [Alphaproteobacteria bacterium]